MAVKWGQLRDGVITLITGKPPLLRLDDTLAPPELEPDAQNIEPHDVEIEVTARDVRSKQEFARVRLQVIDHKLSVISEGAQRRRQIGGPGKR